MMTNEQQRIAHLEKLADDAEKTLAFLQSRVDTLTAERDQLIQKNTALVAENVGLKSAFYPSDIPSEWTDIFGDTAKIEHDSAGDNEFHLISWSWVSNQEEVIKAILLAVSNSIKNPATDAATAAIRAEGVEMLRDSIRELERGIEDTLDLYHYCSDFAHQLRESKGAQK